MPKPPPVNAPTAEATEIDLTAAHTSRVYDYLLGGTNNFAVDRAVAAHAFATYPGGLDGVRADARANRAFLGRAVRYLAGEAGVRQFLDIGTGIPNADNTHAVAQEIAPSARIVYVDNDPIVLAHAHGLLTSTAEGETSYLAGDVREPGEILDRAAGTLDLSQPVALVLVGLLHVIPDEDDPFRIVATLVDAVAPGSYLAVSHMTIDTQAGTMAEVSQRLDEAMHATNPPALRTPAEVNRFFDGLDVVAPGVVPVGRWRPDTQRQGANQGQVTPVLGGVGRKP